MPASTRWMPFATAAGHCRLTLVVFLAAEACSAPAPPEAVVTAIVFSTADTGTSMQFCDRLIAKAPPHGALGMAPARTVSWHSDARVLAIEPLA